MTTYSPGASSHRAWTAALLMLAACNPASGASGARPRPRQLRNAAGKDAIRPFHVALSGRGARRPETPHRGDALAAKETRHRPVAGRAARDDAEARALLGDRVRLAQVRGEAQRPAAIHHRDRWGRHSLHPRAFEAAERVADHRHARMARLDHRAAEDHRSADQSHGTWRERIGRLRRRDSVAAGPRILREAHRRPAGIPSASRAPGSC